MNRNLLIFIFVLIILSPKTLSAQDSKWIVGVEFGINYSNSSEDTAPLKKECPILPKIGVNLEYNIIDNLFIQSGISYSMKGLKSSGNTENLKASVKLNQQLMQIPVIIGYKMNFQNNGIGVGFGAGAYYAYGIGGKTRAVGEISKQTVDLEVNTFGDILSKYDVGLVSKLTVQFGSVVSSLSYEYGLLDIGRKNVLGQPLSYKNRVASFSVGYLF